MSILSHIAMLVEPDDERDGVQHMLFSLNESFAIHERNGAACWCLPTVRKLCLECEGQGCAHCRGGWHEMSRADPIASGDDGVVVFHN